MRVHKSAPLNPLYERGKGVWAFYSGQWIMDSEEFQPPRQALPATPPLEGNWYGAKFPVV